MAKEAPSTFPTDTETLRVSLAEAQELHHGDFKSGVVQRLASECYVHVHHQDYGAYAHLILQNVPFEVGDRLEIIWGRDTPGTVVLIWEFVGLRTTPTNHAVGKYHSV